ncbi:SDH family Clp fold serine proteinase [Rhodovarius lipocyclicus]|uniref:SDH family Clp fold serine proteinase n=1 Tax=Rhodovarius lipocyclicus TaxID=268410 RepID=UPI00135955F0|nr:hypothetical protein [Rhodovarius lipocyclicus]
MEQKDRYLRQLLIRDIESLTGRKLIVYFANRFENDSGIDLRDVAHVAELMGDATDCDLDIMIETGGGVTDAAESIISTLNNMNKNYRIIVANSAKSNGTLIALSSSCIIMGPTSELGPIEPSINNVPCSILDTPQIAQSNFPLHMIGKHALRQSAGLAKRLLETGMMKGRSEQDVSVTIKALSGRDRFPSHGSVVDYREAIQLGLNVKYLNHGDPVWDRIWLLYCMYDFDCRKMGYLKVFEGRSRSIAISK